MPNYIDWKVAKFGFIGVGRVGTALALRLNEKQYTVLNLSGKSPDSGESLSQRIPGSVASSIINTINDSDIIFICVPDDIIQNLVDKLPWVKGQIIIHTSGALNIQTPNNTSIHLANLHPLQTIIMDSPLQYNFSFGIQSKDPIIQRNLEELVVDLGGSGFIIPEKLRSLYHASAVMASNYLVTLMGISTELWKELGYDEVESLRALLPLIKQTITNIETYGVQNALTGPIERGDTGTIEKHIETLGQKADTLLPLYYEMAKHTINIAKRKGSIEQAQEDELMNLINKHISKGNQTE